MSKQVLSIEQMLHLQELGFDTSNASASWYKPDMDTEYMLMFGHLKKEELVGNEEDIPSYTLQDVLDALPKEIEYKDKSCWPCIELTDEWIGYYYESIYFDHKYVYREVVKIDESLIDASYRLLCWAIEHEFVETNKTNKV